MRKILLLFLIASAVPLMGALKPKGKFDWKDPKVKKLCDGIIYVQLEYAAPRIIKMAAVKVDLTNPKLRFKMTSRDKDWGKPMPGYEKKFVIRTRRQTCRAFMQDAVKAGNNMVLAVNGTPFGPWEAPWNHPYADGQGLLVDNGTLVAPPRSRRPGFIVKKDGTFALESYKTTDDVSHIRHAISGFSVVLKNDKIVDRNDQRLAPRTGFGLSRDCKTLYILVADGRQPDYSMGLSTWEVGEMLQYFGAWDGLNMDGGGSTTLWLRDAAGMKILTHYIGGFERSLGACMGIILDK